MSADEKLKARDGASEVCIMLEREQMELVEKLSRLMSEHKEGISVSEVIESVVKRFTDDKIEYFAMKYAIDLRKIPLAEMQQYRREVCIDIARRDTLVFPVKDTIEFRESVYTRNCLELVNVDREKVMSLNYIAFYWRSPLHAITHYAKILSAESGENGNLTLRFDAPEALADILSPRDSANTLRGPRYTTLSILLEAKTLEELF